MFIHGILPPIPQEFLHVLYSELCAYNVPSGVLCSMPMRRHMNRDNFIVCFHTDWAVAWGDARL